MEENKTAVYLTDKEVEEFKEFCLYKKEKLNISNNWKAIHDFAFKMQYGTFTVTVKDCQPVRIDKAMQVLVLTKLK